VSFAQLGRTAARANSIRFVGHRPHLHPVPHLVYVVAGSGTLTVGSQTMVLTAGRGAWLPPRTVHALTLSDGGMAVGPTLSPGVEPPGGEPYPLGSIPALSELITVILCAAPETPEERAPFRAALEELLRSATREWFPLQLPRHPAARAIALEATRSADTLDDLAARRFTSVRHVQRLFLEETGLTFAQWRTRARLNRAIVRLRSGQGLAAAMAASGFTTRQGLLKALSRECRVPIDRLTTDAAAALAA
jgi:AraC-like DNA-binding protein